MLCDRCGENEALVFYTETINGRTRKISVCHDCADFLGIGKKEDFFNHGLTFDFLGIPIGIMPRSKPDPQKMKIKKPEEKVPTEKSTEQLEKELEKAVKEERYEDAARFRDMINEKEKK